MRAVAAAVLLGMATVGGAAAQTTLCADPAGFCGRTLAPRCLERVGAGAIAAEPNDDCAEQLHAYRDCVASAAECGGGGVAKGVCAGDLARELWSIAEADNNCAGYAAFLQVCPNAPRAAFARARSSTLGCGAAALAPPKLPEAPAVAPETLALARSAQTELRRLGLYAGAIDGVWGGGSRAAMRRFQHERGLSPVDGVLSSTGLAALRAAPASASATGGHAGQWRADCDNSRISEMTVSVADGRLAGRFTWRTGPAAARPYAEITVTATLTGDRLSGGRYHCVETGGALCREFKGRFDGVLPVLEFPFARCRLKR